MSHSKICRLQFFFFQNTLFLICSLLIATISSRCGIDITPSEKMMHMVVSAADHISVNKWQGSEYVEFSLIFGFPDDAE
ncbi:MAG TPA: hypothetical protein DD387_00285 [Lachnoclostridium sp.]|nr:hypothetical protein [Lachnoclostridium sp.]